MAHFAGRFFGMIASFMEMKMMKILSMMGALGVVLLLAAGCSSQEAANVEHTAVSGPALIMFYTDN